MLIKRWISVILVSIEPLPQKKKKKKKKKKKSFYCMIQPTQEVEAGESGSLGVQKVGKALVGYKKSKITDVLSTFTSLVIETQLICYTMYTD